MNPTSEGPSFSTPEKTLDNFHIRSTSSKKTLLSLEDSYPEATPKRKRGRSKKHAQDQKAVTKNQDKRDNPKDNPEEKKPGRPPTGKAPSVSVIKATLTRDQFAYLLANKSELKKLNYLRSCSKPDADGVHINVLLRRNFDRKAKKKQWERDCLGTYEGVFELIGGKVKDPEEINWHLDPLRQAIFAEEPNAQKRAQRAKPKRQQGPSKDQNQATNEAQAEDEKSQGEFYSQGDSDEEDDSQGDTSEEDSQGDDNDDSSEVELSEPDAQDYSQLQDFEGNVFQDLSEVQDFEDNQGEDSSQVQDKTGGTKIFKTKAIQKLAKTLEPIYEVPTFVEEEKVGHNFLPFTEYPNEAAYTFEILRNQQGQGQEVEFEGPTGGYQARKIRRNLRVPVTPVSRKELDDSTKTAESMSSEKGSKKRKLPQDLSESDFNEMKDDIGVETLEALKKSRKGKENEEKQTN